MTKCSEEVMLSYQCWTVSDAGVIPLYNKRGINLNKYFTNSAWSEENKIKRKICEIFIVPSTFTYHS